MTVSISDLSDIGIDKRILQRGKETINPQIPCKCEVSISTKQGPIPIASEYFGKCSSIVIILGNAQNGLDHVVETCVRSMHLGEESLFSLNSSFDLVSISDPFVFCIKLISFTNRAIFEILDDEKTDIVLKFKEKGITLYKDGKIEEAFFKFSSALKMLLTLNVFLEGEEVPPDLKELKIALYNNCASCQLHFKNNTYVIQLCSKVLALDSNNVKGLYRRALAYIEINDYDNADSDLCKVLELEPGNSVARVTKMRVMALNKERNAAYQATIKKMFSL